MRYTKLLMLAAALLILPVRNAHANLIVNGGFEDPDIPTGTYALFASIPGWTATLGQIEVQDHIAGTPFEGDQFIELDASSNSYVVDNGGVGTVIGALYNLSFAYSPRPGVISGDNTVQVWVDGILRDTLDGTGGADTSWLVHNYAVLGDGATLVEFRGAGTSNGLGGYIDDVQLNPLDESGIPPRVPEPTSLVLLGLGSVVTGIVRRRKQ